jgi:hypothetical protein
MVIYRPDQLLTPSLTRYRSRPVQPELTLHPRCLNARWSGTSVA